MIFSRFSSKKQIVRRNTLDVENNPLAGAYEQLLSKATQNLMMRIYREGIFFGASWSAYGYLTTLLELWYEASSYANEWKNSNSTPRITHGQEQRAFIKI